MDAVITWVNGSSDAHRLLRQTYLDATARPLSENATNPHRWESAGEILYCLRSIESFAPWLRCIWIVVDDEAPDLRTLSPGLRRKVRIVRHTAIFGEYSAVLPTFNSLSIESMLWRIDGLAEQFLYFNDDVFLAAPLRPEDVFCDDMPVLRGAWVDYSALPGDAGAAQDPARFHHFVQINAAGLAGYGAQRLFASAHVVHPMRRSVMEGLFAQHRAAFLDNIAHRFRDLSQFLPQGLHNHACIAANAAVLRAGKDHLHVKSGQGMGCNPSETRALLQSVADPSIKFLCVNDLPQLERLIPDVRDWLDGVVGRAAPASVLR